MDLGKREAIVLAGGLGTRLRGVIGDFPKCMALINGKPFLYYLFQFLAAQKIEKVILSLGYRSEVVTDWLRENTFPFAIDFVVENEPLGTGGGIQLAMKKACAENVFVLNGDTFFKLDFDTMKQLHLSKNAVATLALKEMGNAERYGTVKLNESLAITCFEEKMPNSSGLINGGLYLVNRTKFLTKNFPEKFSFETEFLHPASGKGQIFGFPSQGYFIDIGIPSDYEKAQLDFKLNFPE
ncbi:MAG: nucleotidyltransferase family protein [Chitinophagaceae bacterium]